MEKDKMEPTGMNDHKMTIQTPEGVTINLPLAGPVSRFLAWLIDVLCLGLVGFACLLATIILGMLNWNIVSAVFLLLFFIIRTCYAILLEWFWQGQTIGKRVLGIRVMDARGLHLQASQIITRNLLRVVDSIPLFYLIGGIACLVNRHSQRLGDMAANTIIVKTKKTTVPDLDAILETNPYNSLHAYPHLIARMRQRITPDEASIALQALIRRNKLLPEARIDLFEKMAGHFKSKVKLPSEALEGVSDEQYIRNVVDVIFKTSS